ncbi:hypothetical protein [Enterobacter asburiae]|uniref:Uncharacterized protein n=1 Tax=Enterobacter asburiae TaxID=61645 RepID=A0A7W3HFH3_ENTAS|nr:hypothetical protein [Enterobacter asburiae]MBA7986092.1 hypothetical protein [Enterobacter asburiae]MBA8079083.1 hypothetical protein [Enterobacter asburiae]
MPQHFSDSNSFIPVDLGSTAEQAFEKRHLGTFDVPASVIVGGYYSSETLIMCVSARLTELENSFVPFGALTGFVE